MMFRKGSDRHLNSLLHPQVHLLGRVWPSFQVWGAAGLALAIPLVLMLSKSLGLSLGVMTAIIPVALVTFFGLAIVTKIITGEERLTHYHHVIAVLVAVTLLVWLLRQPVLPYLDVTVLGVGLFVAVGRVGCLMMGCCHGRPHRWGVCYREEHTAAGFTPSYVGVRLFPIQAVESLWVLGVVLLGSRLLLRGQPAGTTLAWYIVSYATGRFYFEFMRGDAERPYRWGFSEAQWTSIFLDGMVVLAAWAGLLPWHVWPAAASACLVGTAITVALVRRSSSGARYRILRSYHVQEVAEAVEMASDRAPEMRLLGGQDSIPVDICIAPTSLGFQISAGKIRTETGYIFHYALSSRNETMSAATARTLAGVILQLKHHLGPTELIEGHQGVFHLLYTAAEG
ncbi:MAG TPA: hypothetical protein DEP84_16385 [Chloroflexi bacterium]|nr:hypothetical protein [Chloroflexota bacterium]